MSSIGMHQAFASQRSSPPPWTERHEREAFIRLCELAIEHARTDNAKPAALLNYNASYAVENEGAFRSILKDQAVYSVTRIDAEVALVRQRAEAPEPIDTRCTICGHSTNWHEPAGCRGCACVKAGSAPPADPCDACSSSPCICAGEG